MNANKQQAIGLYTIVHREIKRMYRIRGQMFLPPVITTLLYFLIFGTIIGNRVGDIHSATYNTFIAPGLIMMMVITNSYSNACTSLFNVRFQKSIEEILISPLSNGLLLLGFTLGGIIRGIISAILVFFVASFFVSFDYSHLPMALVVITLTAALFSLAGFTNAMLARSFDDIALVPTFILTPLTYLGGVFYTVAMLPSFWQHVTFLNPIYYIVSALRYVLIGQHEVNFNMTIMLLLSILFFLISINLWMLKKGIGLRD